MKLKCLTFLGPEISYDKNYNPTPASGPSTLDKINEWLSQNPGITLVTVEDHPSKSISPKSSVISQHYTKIWFLERGEGT